MYVGVTRAKEELIITWSGENSVFMEGLSGKGLVQGKTRLKSGGWDNGRQMSLFDFMS